MSSLEIQTDEHVFICGQTGTGKSVLAETYLAGMMNVLKLDTKGEVYERRKKGLVLWRGLQEGRDFAVIHHVAELDRVTTPKIILCPDISEMTLEHYNQVCEWVYKREDMILWVDELMEVAPSAFKYPYYLKALYTRGRSKEAVVWACTQRPSDIPAICMSQSSHYFVFNMQLHSDRKKVSDATGMPEFLEQPKGFNFWYWKIGNEHAVLAKLNM